MSEELDPKERKRLEKEAEKARKEAEKAAKQEQKQKEATSRELRRVILKYAQEEKFAPLLAQAVPMYWNNYYSSETADEMDMNESFRFFDWYMFDFTPADAPRLIEQFASDMKEEITVYQSEILEDWLKAPASGAYEFLDFDGFSQQFKLKEFVTGKELVVYTTAGMGNARKGDLLLIRPVQVGHRLEFSVLGAYIPQDEIGDLREKIAAAQAEHPELDQETFMRQVGGLVIIHHALAQSEAKGRYPVARLNPLRLDTAMRHMAKQVAKKFKKR